MQFELNQNKKRRLCNDNNTNSDDIFVLNMNNLDNYKLSNPNELIIINSSTEYSEIFYSTIINGGIKSNIKKIITLDLVITKYIKYMEQQFILLFPNCFTIQVNSFSNEFYLISQIIDNFKIIKNIEYILNDYIFLNNSIYRYNFFTKSIFTGSLSNILSIKIINNITQDIDCCIGKKIISNIVDFDQIENINKSLLNDIIQYQINDCNVNKILFEYIDTKMNIHIKKNIYNIINIDFLL